MNIYLVEQDENIGYDTYNSFICVAIDKDNASKLNPDGSGWGNSWTAWCGSPSDTAVTLIGKAKHNDEERIILASFNAG